MTLNGSHARDIFGFSIPRFLTSRNARSTKVGNFVSNAFFRCFRSAKRLRACPPVIHISRSFQWISFVIGRNLRFYRMLDGG